jgi:predicted nucleic acid-binding protein
MTTSAEPAALVVVDTNVLLAATDTSRATHAAAMEFLETDVRRCALTPQVVREYLVVTTRPVDVSGLGLDGADAVANVTQFLDDMELLPEHLTTTRALMDIVERGAVAGKQMHDANLVAVALAHGATIVTDDRRHFARFAGAIGIETLAPQRS